MGSVQRVEETHSCLECGSSQLSQDYERGELVCDTCGLVIDEDIIDHRAEWRSFDTEQHNARSRVGAPMTVNLHDKGLSTTIGHVNKDAYGKNIPSRNRAQMYRLRKWQRRIRVSNSTERNLAHALSEIDRMSSNMGLPRGIRESASMIYRRAVTKNLIRGRSIEAVAASSIYAATRQHNVPRTLDEFAEAARVSRKELGRTYRHIARELQLKILPSRPSAYLPRFASQLNLSHEATTVAKRILDHAEEKQLLNGVAPGGVVAAAMYIGCIISGDRRSQREIGQACGVTEVTVRNRYKHIAETLPPEVVGL